MRALVHDEGLAAENIVRIRVISVPFVTRMAMSMRGAPDQPSARVSIELGGGRVLTREAAVVYGDAVNPRPRHELEAKFRALASEALDAARVDEVVAAVGRLEDLKDVRVLTALLTAGS